MRMAVILRQAANKAAKISTRNFSSRHSESSSSKLPGSSIKSLALSVHFKQPDFGMKDYEILSRASAFFLAVDPPEPTKSPDSAYSHLDQAEEERKARKLKEDYLAEPAGGPPRPVEELGWLEFCPGNFRPVVHCVAASHVLAPWLWKNYYPQDWLTQVKPEHCAYSLEVFDPQKPLEPLAKFALNPYPIHDPTGRDLAVVHLKEEETALKHMKDLGVEVLYLRDDNELFAKGQEVVFDGFNISEDSVAGQEEVEVSKSQKTKAKEGNEEEDTRIFFPYNTTGQLILGSQDRFLASTPSPLPEGVCGGPTLDIDGKVCGIVEGIIPTTHENKQMAGAASFIPSPLISGFIEYAEKHMLEQIVPESLFTKIVGMKAGKGLVPDQEEYRDPEATEGTEGTEEHAHNDYTEENTNRAYEELVSKMREAESMEEADDIMTTVRRERDEVMDILKREGGDVDDVIKQVRQKAIDDLRSRWKEMEEQKEEIPDAEVIDSKAEDK